MNVRVARAALLAVFPVWCCGLAPSDSAAQPTRNVVSIVGTVVDSRAQPVTGAAVGVLLSATVEKLRRERADLTFHALTDARGRFVLLLPRGLDTVSLVARSGGMAPSRPGPFNLDAADKDVGVLRLGVGVVVAGRVVDEQRKPVRGAAILATLERLADDTTPARFRNQATSAVDGSFQLRGVERGANTIGVTAPTLVARYLRQQMIGAPSSSVLTEIMLFSPTYLRGQVVDASGKPIAGAQLSAAAGRDPATRASSDAQGRFQLGPLARGSKVEFRASAPGFTPMRTDDLASPADGVIVRLNRNGALRGRVLEAGSGRAVVDFEVIFHPKPPLLSVPSSGSRKFHAEEGRFSWDEVLAGPWHISIRASGYQTLEIPGLSIPPGGSTSELLFEMQKGITLRGRIADRESGRGIAGAGIACEPIELPSADTEEPSMPCGTRSDGNGDFALEDLSPRPVALTVSASGYSPVQRTAVADDEPLEVLLDPGASIAGKLVTADSLTPASGTVTLEWPEASIVRGTDKEGGFSFSGLASGTYELSAAAATGRAKPISLALRPGGKLEGVVLALESGGTLHGSVTGLMPGERGRVNVRVAAADGFRAQTAADALGVFEVRGVPQGPVDVTVSTALERQLTRRIEMADAGTATLDVAFPAGYRLSGRVTRAGQPARFVKLVARAAESGGIVAEAESTQAGQYMFEGLARGSYGIVISGSRVISYTVSGDSVVDLDLPALTVTGVVTNANDGRPLDGVRVELRSGEGAPVMTRVSDDSNFQGGFDFAGLDAGEYRLSAYKVGYDLVEQALAVSSSIAGITLPLVPSSGVSLRIRDAATGAALDTVMVIEMLGSRNGNRMNVALDSEGEGRLPPALAGRELVISWPGYAVKSLGRWNGRPLEVALEREAP